MKINVGDTVELKKPHPCGGNKFEVMYVGIDLRIKCLKCGSRCASTVINSKKE